MSEIHVKVTRQDLSRTVDHEAIEAFFGLEDVTILCKASSSDLGQLVPIKTSNSLLALQSSVYRKWIANQLYLNDRFILCITFLLPLGIFIGLCSLNWITAKLVEIGYVSAQSAFKSFSLKLKIRKNTLIMHKIKWNVYQR